jgi:hypothetical protein
MSSSPGHRNSSLRNFATGCCRVHNNHHWTLFWDSAPQSRHHAPFRRHPLHIRRCLVLSSVGTEHFYAVGICIIRAALATYFLGLTFTVGPVNSAGNWCCSLEYQIWFHDTDRYECVIAYTMAPGQNPLYRNWWPVTKQWVIITAWI